MKTHLRENPKIPILPCPRALGVFTALAALLALLAGHFGNEPVLTLLGAVFLAVLAWCFGTLFFMSLFQRKKTLSVDVEMLTPQIKAGGRVELRQRTITRFFALPGTFVRYKMKLATLDGRLLEPVFDLRKIGNGSAGFPVPKRGAYFGLFDELLFLDAPGFFRLVFPVPREKDARLLVVPDAAKDSPPFFIRAGGREKRSAVHYRKTDNLTENRPYVPGDDPRRINWKLYGHGPGAELYVREGENAPPPHSRLLLLIDTQADPALYSVEEGRNEIDMLCENAQKIIFELEQKGIDVRVGYTGGIIRARDTASLARPAALPLLSGSTLPDGNALPFSQGQPAKAGQGETGTLILALPRASTGQTALDHFLSARPPGQNVDLLFLHTSARGKDREEAARICTAFYRRKAGIYVSFHYSDILKKIELKEQ